MKWTSVVAIVLLTLVAQTGFAQAPGEISYHDESVMPEGKIGERIQSIINTVNSNDSERIRRFVADDVPFDAVGVGSWFFSRHAEFTADVVMVDGQPCAKVGRSYRGSERLGLVP